MQTPTLRQLQFLVAIADTGSFSRAAEQCHVTQPTLSTAIREVEAMMDVQLVERHARGTVLTSAGEIAAERAKMILASAQDLVAATRQTASPLTGPFRLGAIPTVAPFLLPSVLKPLRAAYPDLKLFIREDTTDRLLEALRTRSLDAALIALPWPTPGIEHETLFSDAFMVVSPVTHPLASEGAKTPGDLLDEDILLLEDGHCLRDHTVKLCNLPAQRDKTDVTATSLLTLAYMVEGGLGVSMLPRLAVDAGLTKGMDVHVSGFEPAMVGREIGIAWRAGSPREEEARLVGNLCARYRPKPKRANGVP
ncbi:MAG: hydrogen peroxide-inducible genes activator [Pseudomonadota bacterium]